MGKVKFN